MRHYYVSVRITAQKPQKVKTSHDGEDTRLLELTYIKIVYLLWKTTWQILKGEIYSYYMTQ